MLELLHRVGVELWGSRAIGEFSEAQAEGIRSKRKVSEGIIPSWWKTSKILKSIPQLIFLICLHRGLLF